MRLRKRDEQDNICDGTGKERQFQSPKKRQKGCGERKPG